MVQNKWLTSLKVPVCTKTGSPAYRLPVDFDSKPIIKTDFKDPVSNLYHRVLNSYETKHKRISDSRVISRIRNGPPLKKLAGDHCIQLRKLIQFIHQGIKQQLCNPFNLHPHMTGPIILLTLLGM